MDLPGEVDVVEADDAEVARNGQAEVGRGAHRADRHGVAHGEDRCGTDAEGQCPLEGRRPAVDGRRADDDRLVGDLQAMLRRCGPVANETPSKDAFRVVAGGRRRRLDGEDEERTVAELDEVLCRRSRPSLVVDVHRGRPRLRARVDEDHRQPRLTNVIELGVVGREADGDETVDRRPVDRAGEGTIERGDEHEPVALLLDDPRDAFTEGANEGVREDHREGLRDDDTDGPRSPLAQHPGHGVGSVAKPLGDFADPEHGLRGQPIGLVEGEGDGGLADAGGQRDIGDPRPSTPLFHESSSLPRQIP